MINSDLIKDDIKAIVTLGPALKFHGGGHLNHSIFWTVLCSKGTSEPTGKKMNKTIYLTRG